MSEKWTKGEWEVEFESIGTPSPKAVSVVSAKACICTTGLESDPEDVANAHLIASAPEMYEACRFALEIIQDQADKFHQECRCQLCESAPMILNAAMKKARGEK